MQIETLEQFMKVMNMDLYSYSDRNLANDFFGTVKKRQEVNDEIDRINDNAKQLAKEVMGKTYRKRPYGWADRGRGYECVYARDGISDFILAIAECPEMVNLINTVHQLEQKKKEKAELYK